jgi:outer membrane protein OmpA-like peptidoglycan-associated protein
MYTSDDLEGASVKRREFGDDRYGRKNYNLSGTSNDHVAALTLGLRWNITPRDRTHMRKVRWDDFAAQELDMLNEALARIDDLEDRMDDVEGRVTAVEDELANLLENLPVILEQAGAGVGLGEDGELPIPPVFIFFDLDRHNLRPDALKEVLLIASIMNAHQDIVIDVVGLTDIRGSVAHNDALSIRRANEVRNELVNVWGICPSRITHEGRGKSVAPDPNNPRFFQVNRRAEVRFFLNR